MPSTASRAGAPRVERIADARLAIDAARRRGSHIGFVPTMGALHEGHLRLIDAARERTGFVVMSIFVNPLQFGPSEDFARYPRDVDGDSAKASARGVDLLFVPGVEEMYGAARCVAVVPQALHDRWEGAIRPGHFAGVLTVVAKLFNIVRPDVAVFGQKDIQQATLVRAMVRDLDFPLDIVVAPTVREPDGLAMSSRNAYLQGEDRRRALALSRALQTIHQRHAAGETDGRELERAGAAVLDAEPGITKDYLALVDSERLERVATAVPGSIAIVAARVGSTRLIDNLIL